MSDNATIVVANNALAQGYCSACNDVLFLDIEDLNESVRG